MALLLFAAVAGCTLPNNPDMSQVSGGDVVPVDFRFGVFRLGIYPAFFAEVDHQTLLIGGSLRIPCAPYGASAEARLEDKELVLVVTGKPEKDCSRDVASEVFYEALLTDLPTGNYRLRVVHIWKGAAWPPMDAFQHQVTL